ncbi:MAG: hypothetical protein E6Q87_01475 [Cellvibrionales bacterium]|nr:MAG: hypothetical protein E6Q87_01475 [Cellvibrionales bacterium]
MNNDQNITHNAQSLNPAPAEHMHAAAEHAYVADEPIAESTKLKRTTIYLDAQHLSQLAAVDGQPAAWHVRRAMAAYLDRLTTPVAQTSTAPDPLSVSLTPSAHSLAMQVAQRMGVDVGQLISAAVLEQLEVMR